MKYQILSFFNVLKNFALKWIVIFLFLFFFKVMLMISETSELTSFNFYQLLGVLDIKNLNPLENLLAIFQMILIIYTIYIYLKHDSDNSPEFIFVRISSKKWIITKLVVSFLFILLFKALIYGIVLAIFSPFITFEWHAVLVSTSMYFLIPLLILSPLSLIHQKDYVEIFNIAMHFFIIVGLIYFQNFTAVIVVFILMIINVYFNFNLKNLL